MSKYRITLDGKTYEMEVELMDGTTPALSRKEAKTPVQPAVTAAPVVTKPAAALVGGNTITSPMPGTILKVYVKTGEAVKEHQAVLVLEAMKMENEVTAPKDGTLTALHVKPGDAVQGGAPLFEIGE